MASRSTEPAAASSRLILTPVLTLEGHKDRIPSMSYFPDGRRMISRSWDQTVRQWDIEAGKEIEQARDICEQQVFVVAVSRDGRWVVAASEDVDTGELLKARDVETGAVKTLQGHSRRITCIDISADNTLLACGAKGFTVQISSLATGKLVAGPFKSAAWVGAIRFSQDSKKLAVVSIVAKHLEVWDVETQTLDVRVGKRVGGEVIHAPVFWTTQGNIVAAFSFKDETANPEGDPTTIYEFDAWTLETVGAPFERHTGLVRHVALSFDCALLASASDDNTIKLWAFESRQLLASFHIQKPFCVILSPNSRQLAYTTRGDNKIYLCDSPPETLALLNSDATRLAVCHNPATLPVVSHVPRPLRPPPTMRPQQPAFLRYIRKILLSSSRMNVVPPVQNDQIRNPLDL